MAAASRGPPHLQPVGGVSPMSQQQLHNSKMATGAGQRHHRVVVIGCRAVHVRSWGDQRQREGGREGRRDRRRETRGKETSYYYCCIISVNRSASIMDQV